MVIDVFVVISFTLMIVNSLHWFDMRKLPYQWLTWGRFSVYVAVLYLQPIKLTRVWLWIGFNDYASIEKLLVNKIHFMHVDCVFMTSATLL